MTIDEFEELFDQYDLEYLCFERIEAPLHHRPDICAFLLLDKLNPEKGDMVGGAEHDQIWLCVNIVELAKVATPEDVLTLVRCGVRYDCDGLAMFT